VQAIVNVAPRAQEGARVAGMISALVGAGIDGGYLLNLLLSKVHWQAGDRAGSLRPALSRRPAPIRSG
jgi:hypothetical protein